MRLSCVAALLFALAACSGGVPSAAGEDGGSGTSGSAASGGSTGGSTTSTASTGGSTSGTTGGSTSGGTTSSTGGSTSGSTSATTGGGTTGGGTTSAGGSSGGSTGGVECLCPSGSTCGTANGHPVCRTASGIPMFSHVFVIPMENLSLSTLEGADGGYPNAPYLASLAAKWATASDYHGVAHPSLPNYIAMTSGEDVSGIGCDCQPPGATGSTCSSLTCNLILSSCDCPQAVSPNLADEIESAGKDWRNYAENMGAACNVTASGSYAPKHVPFLYYPDVQGNAARCDQHVVDFAGFAQDLAAGPAAFDFLTPNLTDDMHDPVIGSGPQNVTNGDDWLAGQLPAILASQAFQDGGILFIVWDEDDDSGAFVKDAPIGLWVISPLAKQGGYVSQVHADHYSLLATIQDGLGLPRLGLSVPATPLADFFPAK